VTGDLVGDSDAQELTNKTLTSPIINVGVSGSAILDEDDLATDSATQLATQQSIKAYVDTFIALVDDNISFFNGTFLESFDALVTSNGTVITMSLEQTGGGDLTAVFSSGRVILDSDPTPVTIALTAGDDDDPQANYIYILESTGNLTKDTSSWPATEHVKVAYFLVPSAVAVQNDGCYINQNWNDHRQNSNLQGHLSHMCEAIRLTMDGANWHEGVAPNGDGGTYIVTTGTPDEIYFKATAGVAFQMHKHTVPAWNMQTSDNLHVVNWNADAYHAVTDIASIVEDADGVSITNKYYNIVFWGTANKTGEYSPLMCNLSNGSYVRLADAILDTDQYDVTTIPAEFTKESTIGFLICRLTFKKVGTTFTLHNTVDLRGVAAGASAGAGGIGGGGGGGTEFADNVFTVYDSDDVTRILDFDLSSITTGNTRTITPADADMTLLSTTDYTDLTDAGATALHKHDHGGQDGLGDDDHTQYLLHDGTRALTGDWDVGAFGISQQWLQFDTEFVDGTVEGRIQWNADDGTLEYGLPGGNVTLQIGQEQLVKCTNKSGGDIANGETVYVDGAQGSRPTIALADSSQGTGKVPIGVATEDIDDDNDGYVNVGGLVRDMDTSAIASGGIAFLSDTVPGALRATPPAAPNYTTIVGYCIFSNDVAGILFVRILSAPRMQSMSDVDHTAPSVDGQFYRWDESGENRFELAGDSSIDHGGISGLGDDDHTQYILHSLATAANDFLIASGSGAFVKKTLAEAGAILEADLQHDNLQGVTANEHLPGIDEDDFTSNSDAHVPTQQSAKAYVDTYAVPMALADAANDFLVASGDNVFIKKSLAEVGAILEADLDHGNIQGLGDDDHAQYVLHSLGTALHDFLVWDNGTSKWVKNTRAQTASALEADLDHGSIQGLDDDDHGHYLTEARAAALHYTETEIDTLIALYYTQTQVDGIITGLGDTYYTESEIDDIIAGLTTDHGELEGLGDDDHSQYILVAGTRPFTGVQQGKLSENMPEVIQQDAEPGTTYPGLVWVDTDADAAVHGTMIQDIDGDTSVRCEANDDEDQIRMNIEGFQTLLLGDSTLNIYGQGSCVLNVIAADEDNGAYLRMSDGTGLIGGLIGYGRDGIYSGGRIALYDYIDAAWIFVSDEDGIMEQPNQPSFHAYLSGGQSNFAVDTEVTVNFDSTAFNTGDNFNTTTKTFTAPVAGKYKFSCSFRLDAVDTAAGYYRITMWYTGGSLRNIFDFGGHSGDPAYWSLTLDGTVWMDANDTAYMVVYQAGGAAQTDISGGINYSWFTGHLLA
jgi:hypothetical protein